MTRHPADGRILVSVRLHGDGLVWLDSEEEVPRKAAQTVHFILRGEAPPLTEFSVLAWREVFAERAVVTFDDLVPVNHDFRAFVRQETRARAKELRAREARIPPRRRRRHDRV